MAWSRLTAPAPDGALAGAAASGASRVNDFMRQRIRDSIEVKQALAEELDESMRVGVALIDAFRGGHKLLLFGNGGSAADCQHIATEFVAKLRMHRRALPAVAVTVDTSALTAIGNDYGFEELFARQVEALGTPGDVAIGISTSGSSENVLRGLRAARAGGLVTVALTGAGGAGMATEADYCVVVPSSDTQRVQESHILLGHIWAELVEQDLFGAPG